MNSPFKKKIFLLVLSSLFVHLSYGFEAINFPQYRVKHGDSLMTISNQVFGTHQCFQELFQFNSDKLTDINSLEVGKIIDVPPKEFCRKERKASTVSSRTLIEQEEAWRSFKLKPIKIVDNKEKVRKPKTSYFVQVASRKNVEEATSLALQVEDKGFEVNIEEVKILDANWFRVQVGPFQRKRIAEEAQEILTKKFPKSFLKRRSEKQGLNEKHKLVQEKYSERDIATLKENARKKFQKINY